jgi:hypothetical protein
MSPYSRAYSRLTGFMLMLAPEGKEGGGGATLKEQLTKAEKDRDDAASRADLAEQKLKTEETEHGKTKTSLTAAESKRDEYKTSFETEQTAHTETKTKLEALEKQDKTATGKAAEALAKNGIVAAPKQDPKTLAQNKDGAALYAEYTRLKGKARAQFFAKHEKELMAYAADEEKRIERDGEDEEAGIPA